jgi:GH25 family lysozyme M1 (1,4-beta-N-acetylmuramidase)
MLMHNRSPLIRLVLATAVVSAVAFPVAAGAMTSAAAAKVFDGPDVASYQHPHPTKAHPHGQPIDWTKVAKAGKDFAIVKATEGTTYVNPYFAGPYANDYADSAAAGLVHGSYHFARPSLPIASSAKAQAALFAQTIGPVTTKATLPPALDLEVTGGLTPGQLVTWAQAFMLDMRTLTGRTPMLYTYPYFWEHDLGDPTALARYPLWMANFGASVAPISDLWQYTDHAHINGIQDAVDVSKFMGTSGFPWATLSNGTVATPWVTSAPAAPVSVRATAAGGAVSVSWLPGDSGTSPVTSYQVTATPGGAVVTVGGSTMSATVPGLSTSTAYTFTVTATNSVGTGVASAPTAPVTPAIPTTLATSVRSSLRFGAALPLQALLRRADTHAVLPDQQVLVFRRELPANVWVQVRKLSTNSAGLASTVLHPKRSAQLEAVFPGAKGVQRSETFENYVVRPTVTAALSATTVRHGATVTITGSTTPFIAGQRVVREALVNGHWRVWATSKVSKLGKFRFRITPKVKAAIVYRIVVGKAKGRAAGYSSRLKLTVT